MDPAFVAVTGSLLGAFFIKGVEHLISKEKKPAELTHDQKIEGMANEILNGDSDIPADTDSTCAVNHIRIFEQRMIDAGIATDLTICDDKKCKQCYPNLRGNGANEAPAIGTTTYKRPKEERFASRLDRKKSLEREKARTKKALRDSQFRVSNVGGRVIPTPTHVPDNATAVFQSDYAYNTFIIWSWITGSGRQMAFRQNMDIKTFESFPLSVTPDMDIVEASHKGYAPAIEHNVSCSICHKQFWLKKGPNAQHLPSFVCPKCKANTPRGNTLPRPPKGRGGGSPSMKEVMQKTHNEYKAEMNQLNKQHEQLKNAIITLNEMNQQMDSFYKYGKGTPSTGPR